MKNNVAFIAFFIGCVSTIAPQSTQALIHNQIECIQAVSALSICLGIMGYVVYRGARQPHEVTTKSLPSPTELIQRQWMSMQPQFQQGAVNLSMR